MHRLSFVFFLLAFLWWPSYSEEFNPADCPISSEQVEQLQIKINDLKTSLMYLRAIWTKRSDNSKALALSLKIYKQKLSEYEIYIEEARLLVENLQKGSQNLSALLSQAMISLNKAKDDLTNLKVDYETLKQLYADKLNEDLRDKIIIGVVAAFIGWAAGRIVW